MHLTFFPVIHPSELLFYRNIHFSSFVFLYLVVVKMCLKLKVFFAKFVKCVSLCSVLFFLYGWLVDADYILFCVIRLIVFSIYSIPGVWYFCCLLFLQLVSHWWISRTWLKEWTLKVDWLDKCHDATRRPWSSFFVGQTCFHLIHFFFIQVFFLFLACEVPFCCFVWLFCGCDQTLVILSTKHYLHSCFHAS